MHTSGGDVSKLLTEERWAKTRRILNRIYLEMDSSVGMKYDLLNSDRGFLVYVTRAYSNLTPYLKGMHLTLASWQGERDPESGWKAKKRKLPTEKSNPVLWEPKLGLKHYSSVRRP